MAKPTKADLVAQNHEQRNMIDSMRSHIAYLEASLEAKCASLDALRDECEGHKAALNALSTKFIELQDQHAARTRDDIVIRDRAQLLAVARKLSSEGVPCTVRGNYLYHNISKAILAQVGVNS